jgi:hypothetical protein
MVQSMNKDARLTCAVALALAATVRADVPAYRSNQALRRLGEGFGMGRGTLKIGV